MKGVERYRQDFKQACGHLVSTTGGEDPFALYEDLDTYVGQGPLTHTLKVLTRDGEVILEFSGADVAILAWKCLSGRFRD